MAPCVPAVILAFVMPQAAPSASVPSPVAESQQTDDAREVVLALPHVLRKGETARLLVKVGTIGHNQIHSRRRMAGLSELSLHLRNAPVKTPGPTLFRYPMML